MKTFFNSKHLLPPLGIAVSIESIVTFYRGHPFYINENDFSSKRTFILFADFYQLTADTTGRNNGVVLSLPVSK